MDKISRETIEGILREECLKITNGMDYQHNVTHDGIINAIEKLLDVQAQNFKDVLENEKKKNS